MGADVLDLLEFFISRYNHVNEAFRHIDGGVKEGEGGNTTSNGELTLREFESGLRDISCHKLHASELPTNPNALRRRKDKTQLPTRRQRQMYRVLSPLLV